jgi:hypothetical protein
MQMNTLSEVQIEGAARFFAVDVSYYQPNDLKLLPAELKIVLLNHSLKSTDPDKITRARSAFAP